MDMDHDQLMLRLWQQVQKKNLRTVALSNGMTTRELKENLRQIGLLNPADADPSPDEIKRRAAAIRSEWDEETRMNRWIGLRHDAEGLL